MEANKELLEQLRSMKTQLAAVKDDIWKEFDTKIDTIFELFRSQTDPQPPSAPSKVPRDENDRGATPESPARKKQDSKSTPMFDRILAMGENRQMLEQFHARNWLLHRFNAAAAYRNAPGDYSLPYGSMNLPQAWADKSENVG